LLTYLGQSFAQKQPLDFAKTCHSGIIKLQAVMPKEINTPAAFSVEAWVCPSLWVLSGPTAGSLP
jgi:hypothetical protein